MKDYPRISPEVRDVIMNSWRHSTKQQYEVYIKIWIDYCLTRSKDPKCSSLSLGLDFLYYLHVQKYSYSAINTARSALSTLMLIGKNRTPFGSHHLVSRFMKGIFQEKPALPRYCHIWDSNVVIEFLTSLKCSRKLSLKLLTLKLVTLLALLSVQRVQTIHCIKISDISFDDTRVQIIVSDMLKTSSANRHVHPLIFQKFDENRRLCIYRHLQLYLDKTRLIRRSEDYMFVSYQKPHFRVHKSTIARWIRTVLKLSGVDTSIFKAHSTRAASASRAAKFASISCILKAGGWSGESTFERHYRLSSSRNSVQDAILNRIQD